MLLGAFGRDGGGDRFGILTAGTCGVPAPALSAGQRIDAVVGDDVEAVLAFNDEAMGHDRHKARAHDDFGVNPKIINRSAPFQSVPRPGSCRAVWDGAIRTSRRTCSRAPRTAHRRRASECPAERYRTRGIGHCVSSIRVCQERHFERRASGCPTERYRTVIRTSRHRPVRRGPVWSCPRRVDRSARQRRRR